MKYVLSLCLLVLFVVGIDNDVDARPRSSENVTIYNENSKTLKLMFCTPQGKCYKTKMPGKSRGTFSTYSARKLGETYILHGSTGKFTVSKGRCEINKTTENSVFFTAKTTGTDCNLCRNQACSDFTEKSQVTFNEGESQPLEEIKGVFEKLLEKGGAKTGKEVKRSYGL